MLSALCFKRYQTLLKYKYFERKAWRKGNHDANEQTQESTQRNFSYF